MLFSQAAAAENEEGFMNYLKISTCLLYLKNKSSIMKSFSQTVLFFFASLRLFKNQTLYAYSNKIDFSAGKNRT